MNRAIKDALNSWEIKEGILFENGKNNTIERMYMVGDRVDCVIIEGDINSDNYHSVSYNDCTIVGFKNDGIVLAGGYIEGKEITSIEEDVFIPTNRIAYMHADIVEKKLSYKEQDIINELLEILPESAKTEFASYDVDTIYMKWKEAILNRFVMCRLQGNLKARTANEGNHENVYAAIKYIVSICIDKLKN
jgi:hypothetical protein